jgi:hypothetical protein
MPYRSEKGWDPADCVARRAGSGNLVFCLAEQRAACGYALPFGEAFFCRHPEGAEIAARTGASLTPSRRRE